MRDADKNVRAPMSVFALRDLEAFEHGIVADDVKLHVVDESAGDDEIFLQLFRRVSVNRLRGRPEVL